MNKKFDYGEFVRNTNKALSGASLDTCLKAINDIDIFVEALNKLKAKILVVSEVLKPMVEIAESYVRFAETGLPLEVMINVICESIEDNNHSYRMYFRNSDNCYFYIDRPKRPMTNNAAVQANNFMLKYLGIIPNYNPRNVNSGYTANSLYPAIDLLSGKILDAKVKIKVSTSMDGLNCGFYANWV